MICCLHKYFFLLFLIFLYPICHHISGNTEPRNKDRFPRACDRVTTWLLVLWLLISAFAKPKHTSQCYFVGTAHYSIRYNLLSDTPMSLSALWIYMLFLQQNRSWKLFSSSYFLSFSIFLKTLLLLHYFCRVVFYCINCSGSLRILYKKNLPIF